MRRLERERLRRRVEREVAGGGWSERLRAEGGGWREVAGREQLQVERGCGVSERLRMEREVAGGERLRVERGCG